MAKKTSKKKPPKKKNGRPSKKDKIDLKQLTILAEYGLTDKQLSKALGICEASLNNYKKDKKFLESLKKGKKISDSKVVQSLYKRALGYNYTETHKERLKSGVITNKEIEKEITPDTTACIFWLKNRMPNDWRDRQEIKHSGSLNHRFASMTNSELIEYEKQYGIIK